jgi:hypothetical protein
MGRTLFMSLDSPPSPSTAPPFPGTSDVCPPQTMQHPWYLRVRWLLSIWAILSVMWGVAVGYDLCQRVSMQADMSRDVENDLDQGFVGASCTGAQCIGKSANAARTQNWSGIASTYIKFGSNEMAECILGPPLALLAIGLGAVFVLRRRPFAINRAQMSNR